MKNEIEVSNNIEISKTSFKGNCISLPYLTLVELLGEPNEDDGYKVDAQWSFKNKSGEIATLYNWKNGPNYTGRGRIEDIKEWNIGGHYKSPASESLIIVMRALVERGIDKNIPLADLLENT